jgi:hypothetical protein
VRTNILFIPELIQFEIGISTSLYLPAIGTAGLLRLAVNGYNLVPAPPPNITATVECDIWLNLLFIDEGSLI